MKALKEISCIIIDDEVSSQKVLQHFISETENLELKQTCSNSEDAFRFLQLNPDIDLLFLDINMPGQSGLDFYKSLKNPPSVIFTTAYPQYAVDGFEVNAIDYLLKPIAYNRFLVAINKYLSGSKTLGANTEFITINENKTLHRVNFSDILFIEAQGDYVKVQLIDNIIVTHSTFSGFLEKLPSMFLRIHKSFCINLTKLKQLSGNQIVIDKYKVPIGQTYKETVLKALDIN